MKNILLLIILIAAANIAKTQSVSMYLIGTAGDSYKNSTYQLDWSLGEILTETYTGTQYSLTQGLHQGNYTITSIIDIPQSNFTIIVYPNPASNYLVIDIKNGKPEDIIYSFTDINGRLIQSGHLKSQQKELNIQQYSPGIYFINIQQNNQLINSFRIVKK